MTLDEMKDELTPVIKRMPAYIKLAWALYREPSIGKKQKTVLGMGVLYAVSPIDLIPGFIPVLGQLDDIIVALTSLKMVLKGLPEDTLAHYRELFGISLDDLESDLSSAKKISGELLARAVKLSVKGIYVAGKAGLGLLSRVVRINKSK